MKTILILGLVLAGCTGMPVRTGTWVDPTLPGFRFDRAMVVGVAAADDRRRSMEYEAMQVAAERGLELVPASALLPEGSKLTQARIAELVEDEGFPAVFTLEVLREGRRTERVHGRKEVLNQEIFDHFLRHYVTIRQEVLLPDTEYTYTVYKVEAKLYQPSSGKIAWSATWRVADPPGFAPMLRNVSRAAFDELKLRGYF